MSHISTVTAKDAKNRFGELLDASRLSPVRITKNGREVAVVMSVEEYKRFEEAEDAIWAKRAQEAHDSNDYLSAEQSDEYINSILNAKDSSR